MTKYIELEEVLKLLEENPSSNNNKIIQALPEPIDFIATIDAMIEKINKETEYTQTVTDYTKDILQDLKSRLSPKL